MLKIMYKKHTLLNKNQIKRTNPEYSGTNKLIMKAFKKISILTVIVICFLPLSNVFAGGPPPPPTGGGAGCWPPPCVPIDGGISFLIAAGIGLGAKKLYNLRKK